MKYTRKETLRDGSTVYRFIPPNDAKLSGVVENITFLDGRKARHEIPKLIQTVEDFRSGKVLVGNLGVSSTLQQVVTYYFNTGQFKSLSLQTQKTYEYSLTTICSTTIYSRSLGNVSVKHLTPANCTELYETWANNVSVDNANQLSRILSVILNYCRSIGLIDTNPMSFVKKRKHEPRSVVWTREQVELFIETAFSEFKWRNIGLLALLCYEWGQRPIDIRQLEWSSINFDDKMVTIKQSKRGATIQLPLDDKMFDLLKQQETDWGFQKYVIPHQRPSDGEYRPITTYQVSILTNQVKAFCELPNELQMGDLRKTAITELIESGVDQLAIMSVTGHKNVQSLNPYNKHNFNTAKSALEMRRK
jgi:integrase